MPGERDIQQALNESGAIMNVGFFQFAPQFGETQRNLESMVQAIDSFQGHLLVFPELALSGYQFLSKEEAWELAEDVPAGTVCQQLEQAIRGRELYVVVGLAERAQDCLYNSARLDRSERVYRDLSQNPFIF